MKRFVMTLALTCLLSVSAFGGEVSTSGIASPAPPATTQTTSPTSPGETPSVPGDVSTSGFAEQVSDAALSALLTALGLLTVQVVKPGNLLGQVAIQGASVEGYNSRQLPGHYLSGSPYNQNNKAASRQRGCGVLKAAEGFHLHSVLPYKSHYKDRNSDYAMGMTVDWPRRWRESRESDPDQRSGLWIAIQSFPSTTSERSVLQISQRNITIGFGGNQGWTTASRPLPQMPVWRVQRALDRRATLGGEFSRGLSASRRSRSSNRFTSR